MAVKQILYVSALDEEGNLCFAFNEDKTQKKNYVCPNCGVHMTLKKSDKVGKYTKRPHFAHKSNEDHDCSPETVLHNSFKTELSKILKKHIENKKSFDFEWDCPTFSEKHSGNMLKEVCNVYVEKDLGICRPDILLTDKHDKPIFAVEIVVTHKPEEQTIQYYKENRIFLYQINLESDEDLKDVEEKAKHPVNFNVCRRQKCTTCGQLLKKREIFIKQIDCWSCRKPMRITTGLDEEVGTFYPEHYRPEELEYAQNNSVILKNNYSNERDEKYLSNTCPSCNKLYGNFYLFDNEEEPLVIDNRSFYYCDTCEYNESHPFANSKCDKCNNTLTTRTINVYNTICHTCNTPIIIADGKENELYYDYDDENILSDSNEDIQYDAIECDDESVGIDPYQFTKEQIDFANCNGANIKQVISSIYSGPFYANVCPTCGDFGNEAFDNEKCKLVLRKYFPHCVCCEPFKERKFSKSVEKCNVCGEEKVQRIVIVVEAYCYRCKKPMKVAFVKEQNNRISVKFNSRHISFATRYGVKFQDNEQCPMVCPTCNAPISINYIDKYTTCKEIAHESSAFCPTCYKIRKDNNKYAQVLNFSMEEFEKMEIPIIPQK